jgi:hypothetical protein
MRCFLVLAVLCVATFARADDWKTITRSGSRFEMPAMPSSTNVLDVEGTPGVEMTSSVENPYRMFDVYIAPGFFQGKDREKAMDSHIGWLAETKPITQRKVTIGGRSGRQWMYRDGDSDVFKQMITVDDDLYVMTTAFKTGAVDDAAVQRFFASFKEAARISTDTWEARNAASCRCRFEMPGKPVETTTKNKTGSVTTTFMLTRDQGDRFAIISTLGVAKTAPARQMLEATADSAMKGQKGTRKKIQLGSYPGLQIEMESDSGSSSIARFYVANGNLIGLMYVWTGTLDELVRDRFFETFRVK